MNAQVLPFRPMVQNLQHYPNRIRELRKARGLSQQALGDRIGASGVHVGYLELGKRELGLSAMRAIARALGVDPVDLLAPEDNPLASNPRSRRLLTHWAGSDEPGRQAIERVAESMVGYKAQTAADGLASIARPPAPADDATPDAAPRKKGAKN